VLDRLAVPARADHGRTEPGQFLDHLLTDPAETDDQDGHLRDLAHLPAAAPVPVTLLSEQPREILRAGEQPEDRELGQRSAVDAGRRGEEDSAQLRLAQSGGFHLPAAAGRHRLHPTEPRVRVRRPLQGCGVDIGNAVEDLGRVDHVIERLLLAGGPLKRRIPGEVGGMAHRGVQRLVADQVDAGLQPLDQLAVCLGQRRGDDHA
jgi:hypothetical protein